MAFVIKDGGVWCTTCKTWAKTLRQHEADLHSDDPEWFFEPWDESDYHLNVCPKCKNKDFVS